MSTPAGSQEYLVSALTKLRSAALLMIIATLLTSVGTLAIVLPLWFTGVIPRLITHEAVMEHEVMPGMESKSFVSMSLVLLLTVVIVALVGFILALIAVYGKLLPSAEDFTKYSHEFSTPSTLIKIGYIVGLIVGIVGVLTLIFIIGFFLLIVAWIFLILGKIGLAILCFKINDKLKSGIFIAAGILFILSLIPPMQILSFIGWILAYIECSSLLGRVTLSTQAS
ncbi:MAG: DUF973 family protein [Desulfurococcales archaeon]|nr:DUF973 family protein [Desulfurococcales archaeon]